MVDTRRLIESCGPESKHCQWSFLPREPTTSMAATEGIDEVQAGSYALMDWWYTDIRPEFRQAMSVLTLVVSRPRPNIAIH